MLSQILDPREEALLKRERDLLADVHVTLVRHEAPEHALAVLRESIRQLDELFLIAVVGEFNSGKSALINALLGQEVLEEGVTPTTARIQLVQHGAEVTRRAGETGTVVITAPTELLRELTIVDTPGTNALDREHEALTRDLVPRADLVLFVTSVDRPLSESERAFLESIRQWGKKVAVILNKKDILRQSDELSQIREYVVDGIERLLDFVPPVLAVSARAATAARRSADASALAASGLPSVEQFLRHTLDSRERVALKLHSPLGVATRLLTEHVDAAAARQELLSADLAVIDDIERQLEAYAADVQREFGLRLADIDNLLHGLEKRGVEFLDDTVRLPRLRKLLRKEELRASFETQVVADTPQQVEAKVESLIDWLISSDVNQWQAVVGHVNRRRALHEERVVGEIGGRFGVDRARLLDTVGRAARESLARYDRAAEARRMVEEVQRALAGTALAEIGAVGLGTTVAILATSAAADATGLIAAGMLAVLGLFILPHRRRRATADLRAAISAMRSHLMEALTDRFRTEAADSHNRIRDTIAPYTRYVRAERDRLQSRREELGALRTRIDELRSEIDGADYS